MPFGTKEKRKSQLMLTNQLFMSGLNKGCEGHMNQNPVEGKQKGANSRWKFSHCKAPTSIKL